MPTGKDESAKLQAENARLIALLESHGIEWRSPLDLSILQPREPAASRLSTADKVALFRRLFRGRTDVYPLHAKNNIRESQGRISGSEERRK